MHRYGAALFAAVILTAIVGTTAQAYDKRSGSRTCATGYNVGLSTTTTSSENHIHFYESSSGATKTFSTPLSVGFGSTSHYRVVETWSATTNGWFDAISVRCNPNPI
jgi:hypothetical protein